MKPAKENTLGDLSKNMGIPASGIGCLSDKLDSLQLSSPIRIAELAIELQLERLRVQEIQNARDAALHSLSESYQSIVQKNGIIAQMQQKIERNVTLEEGQVTSFKLGMAHGDPPPQYEPNCDKQRLEDARDQMNDEPDGLGTSSKRIALQYNPPLTDDPIILVNARNAYLASIPLPDNPPDPTLTAIVIPAPFTIQEFLNSLPPGIKAKLADYKVLEATTSYWCSEREEHGYMYAPKFKCITNQRVVTAHCWSVNDSLQANDKPIECFFRKDSVWYYAGLYKMFLLDDMSSKEWEQLPPETTALIVKETIAGRKNSSPQNTYEIAQLYAAGALKVACVGLQCVGFNQEIYQAVLEHSIRFSESKRICFGSTRNDIYSSSNLSPSTSQLSATPANSGSATPVFSSSPPPGVTNDLKSTTRPVQTSHPGVLYATNGLSLSRHSVGLSKIQIKAIGSNLVGPPTTIRNALQGQVGLQKVQSPAESALKRPCGPVGKENMAEKVLVKN